MHKKNWLNLLLAMLGVVLLIGCVNPAVREWPEMHGRVVDQQTGEPIPDTFVVVTWVGNIATAFVDSRTDCFHGYVTRSDTDGWYSIPAWTNEGQFAHAGNQRVEAFAYKHNHHEPEEMAEIRLQGRTRNHIASDLGVIVLVKDSEDITQDEKLNKLWLMHGQVDCVEAPDRDTIALYRLIEDEAKEQGFAKGYAATIENMRYGREVREFGEQEAYKRHLERINKKYE